MDESMQILNEALLRFGPQLSSEHAALQEALLPVLDDNRATLRKRAMHCIAALSSKLSDDALNAVIGHVLAKLQDKSLKPDIIRAHVQTVSQIR